MQPGKDTRKNQSIRIMTWLCSFSLLISLAGLVQAQVESGMVSISVSEGLTPVFSWQPDSTIGRLIVKEGSREYWATEAEGSNSYKSPIQYGAHPAGAAEDEAAKPLVAGRTYKVSLFKWISFNLKTFQLVGSQEFTPSDDSEEGQEAVAGEDVEMEEEHEEEHEEVAAEVTEAVETEMEEGEEAEEEVAEAEEQEETEETVTETGEVEMEEDEEVEGEVGGEEDLEEEQASTDEKNLEEGEEEGEEDEEEEEDILLDRPGLLSGSLSSKFGLTGTMRGTAWWSVADSIGNLVTVEPEEGGEPAGRTVVKVLTSPHEIVIGARCYDDNPDGIVAFSKGRDSELDEEGDVLMLKSEDHLLIVLDTFQDGRSGYVFAVNPLGARFDGLVIEHGEDVNRDWDTIWEAKTSRDDAGWYAEIRIPIKSLGYKKGLTSWGFNVQRRVQRLQEISRWSGASQDYEIYQTSRSGLLTGLPEFDFGVGLSLRPSVVGQTGQPNPDDGAEYDGDISFDVTQRLGANLLSALTVNTDFAETEVDVRQVNLTRFDLFFPEKRSFFLEGADIFQFGVGLDEDTMIPFFSRRVGLLGGGSDELLEIPINAGGKINGRVGNTNIGAMVVNTRQIDSLDVGDADEDIKIHVPNSTMGVVRLNQNILAESSVGMLATFGDQQGRSDSWMAGADFTYRTSEFLNEKNFSVNVWGLLNNREDLEGDKGAFGLRIDYPNDFLDMNFTTMRIGEGFDPSLGFTPRNNIHFWSGTVEVNPRPPWPWLRQGFMELSGSLYNNLDGNEWESYDVTIKPLDWLLESGDRFDAGITPQGDKPPEAFEIASGVDVPSFEFDGPYKWTRFFVGAKSARKRRVSSSVKWEFGDYYNGDLSTVEASVAIKPSSFLTVEFTGERNSGKMMALPEDVDEEDATELVETDFTEEVYGVRFVLNFSPDFQISSFTQYDTEGKELGSNNRLRWTFNPLGDLLVIYNHNLLRNDEDRWEFVSNDLPIKVQYTWRF